MNTLKQGETRNKENRQGTIQVIKGPSKEEVKESELNLVKEWGRQILEMLKRGDQ